MRNMRNMRNMIFFTLVWLTMAANSTHLIRRRHKICTGSLGPFGVLCGFMVLLLLFRRSWWVRGVVMCCGSGCVKKGKTILGGTADEKTKLGMSKIEKQKCARFASTSAGKARLKFCGEGAS